MSLFFNVILVFTSVKKSKLLPLNLPTEYYHEKIVLLSATLIE
jgi:hypothetical protein